MKKILFLIPSLVGGGAERTLVNILHKLDYTEYRVDLAVVSNVGTYINQIPDAVKIIPLFKNDQLVRILALLQKKFGIDYFFKHAVRKKCKGDYDTAICFLDSNFTDLLFYLPNARRRVTWVHSSYKTNDNFYKFYKNKEYRDKLVSNRYSKLDDIVFVSEDAKDEFTEIFGAYQNMHVVYNLMDEQNVLAKAGAFPVDTGKSMLFISVGSLYPVKGYDKLVAAAKILKDKALSFKIHIYGKGFLHEELLKQIKDLELEGHIELKGFVTNPYPYIKNSDVFMMTSVSEAMPMALCESMLLGKPVLVTNCSGCREVVGKGEYGMMVEQTPESIANGMQRFIEGPELLHHYSQLSSVRAEDFRDDVILSKIKEIVLC